MNATGAIGQTRAKRVAIILVAAAATAGPSIATAQAWSVQSGATGRGEYTDNYFFTAENPQSAFTASISPFITAARRTENDEIAALLAVGANRVWGPSPTTDYLSGRFALNASARQVRSTWAGNISIMRAPSLQDELTPSGSILALAYVDNAAVNGSYTYEFTELWSLGVNAGGYGNRYENVEGGGTQPNNHGYSVGATTRYAFSDRTPLTFSVSYSYFSSDLTRSESVTPTLGIVHQFSPSLTISATVGGFWTTTEAGQAVTVCPTTPGSCTSITTGETRRNSGPLYGGSVTYDLSEQTRLDASFGENLVPSSSGVLTKNDSVNASLIHRFSDTLTGRLGASYTRSIFPGALSEFNNSSYSGEIGATYRLGERWILETGYRYTGAQYSGNALEPQVELRFLKRGLQLARRVVHELGRHPSGYAGIAGCGTAVASRAPGRYAGTDECASTACGIARAVAV